MLFLEILPGGFIISESSRGKERVLFQFDQFMEEIVILLFFFCVCVCRFHAQRPALPFEKKNQNKKMMTSRKPENDFHDVPKLECSKNVKTFV